MELSHAIVKGYTVVKIVKVWHFPDTSDTLFGDYVKTFLKFKQEASGFPSYVVTDAEKQSYVKDYFEKEGIQLDIDKISLNPARRSINKYLLNSLWGRIGLRCNLPTAELLTEPEDFARYIFGNCHVIKHFAFCYAEEDPASVMQRRTPPPHAMLMCLLPRSLLHMGVWNYTNLWTN